MVGHLESNVVEGSVDGKYWPPSSNQSNTNSDGPREWFFIFDLSYGDLPAPGLMQEMIGNPMPVMWWGTPARLGDVAFQTGDEFLIEARHLVTFQDVWEFNPVLLEVAESESGPRTFALAQNYPNPFSANAATAATKIVYALPVAAKVNLKIFNLLGQEVITLTDKKLLPGTYVQEWRGLDRFNRPVANGVYFCRLQAGDFMQTKKLLFMK